MGGKLMGGKILIKMKFVDKSETSHKIYYKMKIEGGFMYTNMKLEKKTCGIFVYSTFANLFDFNFF